MSNYSEDDQERRLKIIGLGQRSIRKTYYNELKQKLEELHSLNRNLELLVEERSRRLVEVQNRLMESEKMAMIGSLVAGIAHEINTPVGNAITALSFLEEQTDQLKSDLEAGQLSRGHLQKYLETTKDAAVISLANLEKAADLIQRFKQVSVDQSVSEFRKVNLHRCLQDIVLTLKPKLAGHTVNLQVPGDLNVEINPGALYQIVTNLMINSLMHGFEGHPGGTIHINAGVRDQGIFLLYRDNGKGIPEEIWEHIFEPFFTTKRGQGGTGLGLSIISNLVTQNFHGTITFHPAEDQGSVFELWWPMGEP